MLPQGPYSPATMPSPPTDVQGNVINELIQGQNVHEIMINYLTQELEHQRQENALLRQQLSNVSKYLTVISSKMQSGRPALVPAHEDVKPQLQNFAPQLQGYAPNRVVQQVVPPMQPKVAPQTSTYRTPNNSWAYQQPVVYQANDPYHMDSTLHGHQMTRIVPDQDFLNHSGLPHSPYPVSPQVDESPTAHPNEYLTPISSPTDPHDYHPTHEEGETMDDNLFSLLQGVNLTDSHQLQE